MDDANSKENKKITYNILKKKIHGNNDETNNISSNLAKNIKIIGEQVKNRFNARENNIQIKNQSEERNNESINKVNDDINSNSSKNIIFIRNNKGLINNTIEKLMNSQIEVENEKNTPEHCYFKFEKRKLENLFYLT
jgi:hypothetical protein